MDIFARPGNCPSIVLFEIMFEGNQVHVLQWPAKSPDVNIIENIRGTMAHKLDVD